VNSAKVLFTHSYFLALDSKQLQTHTPYPPLATLYAASLVRDNNFEVRIKDVQFETKAASIVNELTQFEPNYFIIYDDGFNYLTKMCLTNMREEALNMIALAKLRNCTVIVSSSDATDHFEKYLDAGADYIISGEGEITLIELLKQLNSEKSTETVNGIIYKQNERYIKTPPRNVLRELDELPMPAWNLIDLQPYKDIWLKNHGYFSMNLATTRGCPYKCNWCAKPIYGNRYNSHSPGTIVEQIKYLRENNAIDHIWFADDIFGLKPMWVEEFSTLLKKENIRIPFKIQSRADLLVEEKTVKQLAEAGCDTVWMGAESGSQKILDAMDKGIKIEEIEKATSFLKQYNIQVGFFLQFGYPGENLEDIKKTINLVNNLLPEEIGISISYPLPGTKFYETVKNELVSKSNWSDSDDLSLMFKNTYSAEFYKQLHRFIHQSFRKNQSLHYWKTPFSKIKDRKLKLKRMLSLPFYFAGSISEKSKLKKIDADAGRSI